MSSTLTRTCMSRYSLYNLTGYVYGCFIHRHNIFMKLDEIWFVWFNHDWYLTAQCNEINPEYVKLIMQEGTASRLIWAARELTELNNDICGVIANVCFRLFI